VCVVDLDQETGAEQLDAALEAASGGHVHVIVLTDRFGLLGLSEAINRGVSGVVLKSQPPEILRKAIVRVHAGELWLNREMTAGVLGQLVPSHQRPSSGEGLPRERALTKREREIVALVGRGWRNSEIAQSLYISDVTVRNHLTSIFRKLSLSSRVELAAHAYRHGLASLPTRASRRAKVALAMSRQSETASHKA
jgi:DNA-binding NarL/FixJ family response regulator